MCRGGHMFAPTKTWRRWHRKVNIKNKRYAVCSALAASAVPALVMARGHRIEKVSEVPLVLSNAAESIKKTKDAMAVLKAVGALPDVEKASRVGKPRWRALSGWARGSCLALAECALCLFLTYPSLALQCVDTKKIRAGKGKWRNRRYVTRKGPMVIFDKDEGITKAFRNIPGVEVASVHSLNLLQLAPGGHLGRFCIWTQGAVEALDKVFGTHASTSEAKKGWRLPRACVTNSDASRLVNDGAVQSIVAAPKEGTRRAKLRKNPLRNLGAMLKLNPYFAEVRRAAMAASNRKAAKVRTDAGHRHRTGRRGGHLPVASLSKAGRDPAPV